MKKYLGKIKYVILTTLIVLFLFTTVAYSGLASKLAITSEVMFRALADIRVTNIKLEKTTGNALESYEPKYNVDTTTTGFELPSSDSSITYRVTVTNRGKRNQTIYEFIKNSINADGVNIKIEGYTEKDIIPYESSVDFLITFTTTNPSNQTINVIEKYDFREVYTIEYDANGGTNAPKEQIKYQKEDIALREEIPTWETYKFIGWSETQGSETAEYKAGGAYTLDKDVILYAVWQKNAAKIDLNYNVDGTWYYSGYNNRIQTGLKVNGEDQGYLNDFGKEYEYGTSYEIYGFKLDGEEIPYSKKYTVDGTNHLNVYFNTMNFTVNDESLGSISHEQLIVIPGTTYTVTDSTITMSDGRIVTSSPKTVTGYTTKFTGYTITPNSTTINAKTTVKANFTKEANTYKITLDNKSATTAGTTSIYEKYNTGIYLDSVLANAMTTSANPITKPTRSYTVSFNANNTGITIPSAITKSYSYSGYYTDAASGTQMINENGYITSSFTKTSYTANATLYAHWKAKPSVTIPSISKTGYTCSWNTSADGKGTTYNGGDVTDKLNTQTLYAVCAANTYTVTYNSNGGSGTMTNDTATYNSNYITKKNTFIKTGYTFNGWNEKADGTGTVWGLTTSGVYESGKSWKWTYTKNITLYAQWKANTNTKYVVKHYKQKLDGTYPSEADDTDELIGTTDSNVSPAVKSYAGFTSPSVQTVTIAADGSTVVIYKYTRNKYTYTLESATGVSTTGSTASGSYYYGSTITLKASASAGYTFNGWTSSNTNLVANQTNASATFTMPAGNITMTPSVNLASYTVTYDATTNGGSTAKQTISTKYKSLVDLTKKAEKTGYEFVGWNTNKDATSALSSYEMPANDVTLYAIYSKTLTATFNYYNSKSEIRSITIYNNATSGSITSPAALGTPSGYTFRHYSTSNAANASKTIDANSAIVLTSNQTYYASYQKTVTLNFYYHSGTDIYANTQTSTTASGIQYLGYNNVIINSNVSIPSAVTKSTGYCGTSYKGVTAANTTTSISINTGTTNYYAYYQATITYYYYNGSAHTTGTGTRTAYSNGTNYVTTASAAPTPSSYDGAAFKGWSYTNDSANDRNPAYTAMTALYAYYQKTVNATFNYYDGSKAASVAAGNTRTYISKSGGVNTLNTNITIPDAAKASRGSYTYRGISTSNAANASVVTSTTANTTYYSSYTYAITVNFTANGGTGTAPSSIAGTGYMNYSGSKIGISVTMPSNTFKKDGYTFGGWNDTVANKTYTVGTSTTIDSTRDIVAKWDANTLTFKAQSKSITYNTTSQSVNIDGADNGTGNYSYSIVSGNTDGYFSISDLTISTNKDKVPPVGTYQLKVQASDNNSGATAQATITITVNPATITYTANSYEDFYDGNSHSITVNVTKPTSGATITYSLTENGTYSATKPTVTNATTSPVTVYFKISANNYNTVSDKATITINKTNSVSPKLTAYSGTYDGNPHTIGVTGGSGGTIKYSTDQTNWSTTLPTVTNATYTNNVLTPVTVYVKVFGDGNHTDTSIISSTITIDKKTDVITMSSISTNYTGEKVEATATAESKTTITFTYYNGTTCSGTALSNAPINVGDYSVKATSAGNNNYKSNSACATIKINNTNNPTTVSAVTGLKYGTTSNLVTTSNVQGTIYYSIGTELTSSNYKTSGSTSIPTGYDSSTKTYRNAATYKIYYYVDGTGTNYESTKGGPVSVTISKASGSISYATKSVTKTYGDAKFTNSLTKIGDGIVSYSSSNTGVATIDTSGNVTITGAGTTTITATVTDGTNYTYATKTATYTLIVDKITNPVKVSATTGIIYGENKEMVSTNGVQGTIYYSVGTVLTETNYLSAGSTKVPTSEGKSAGDYNIYYFVKGNSNYKDASNSDSPVKVTISAKTLTIPSSPSEKTYNGSSQGSGITCPAGSTAGGTQSATNQGTYTQTCTLSNTTNYMWTDKTVEVKSIIWKINPKSITPTAYSVTYNGGKTFTRTYDTGIGNENLKFTYSTFSENFGSYTYSTSLAANKYTLAVADGTGKKSNYTITNPGAISIGKASASISYATTSITKTYGDAKFTNTLTKTGDGTVKYTSGDTKVATVDSTTGEVTITGAGTTTITATVTDGTNYTYTTKTATYTLKVNAKVITITFSLNNASGMTLSGSTSVVTTDQKVTCSITSGSTCTITSPTITAPSTTPTVVGWNTSASGTTSTWNENTSKAVSSNATYYAITKKIAVTLKATASGNWSTLNGTTTPTCTLPEVYNGAKQATSCEVTMPTVTAPSATPTFVGWNQDSNGTTNDSSYNTATNKLTLTSSNTGKKWYAITRSDAVTFTGKINANNATLSSTSNVSCTIAASYNGINQAKSCYAKMPTITAPSATPTFVGWNQSANGTTNDSSYSTSTGNLTLTSSNTGKTWYAITKKIAVTLKATASGNWSTLNGTTTPTCTLPEVYNGGMQASSCEVTMPTVTAPSATPTFVGWNQDSNGTTNDSSYNTATNKLTLTSSNTGKKWYAITRSDAVTFTGKINANNATLSSTSNVSCTIASSYNGINQAKSCSVKMPTVTGSSTTPTFVGWNTSANGTTNDSSYSTSTGNLTLTSSNTGKTWYAITKKNAVTLRATASGNNASLSGSTTPTCTLPEVYNGGTQASSCVVTMPTVTAPSATPTFIGWNRDSNGTTNDSSYNTTTNKLTLTNSNTGKTWYAITRSNAVTLTGKVNANNASLSSTSDVSCTIASSYNGINQAKSCSAKMPTVTGSSATPTFVGWNQNANGTTNDSSYNTSTGNLTLTSSNTGKTWYAITKKNATTLKATANGNWSTLSGSTNTPTCTLPEVYNGDTKASSCEVTMPTVTPHSNTPTFVGWNLSASGTTNDSNYNMTTNKLTLTNSNSGKNWYAITRKDAVTLTVKVDANSGTLSSTSDVGCTIGETYNAMGQAKSCYAKMPTGTKTGYSHIGWNTDSTATTSDSNYGTSSGNLKITKDNTGTIWYAIYNAKSYKVTFNPNGGKVSPTYKLVTFDSNYGKDSTLPTPTRADSTDSASGKTISYAFEGWYTAANGGTKVTDETLVNTASNHSIYAHWISKPIITGGSADWFNKEVNIELEVPSTSDTGSVKYQYYVSTSNSSQVGGEWKDTSASGYAPVSANGIHYVFYRAISSAGVYSNVSNYRMVRIDTEKPTISVTGNPTSWVTTDVTLKVSASDSVSGLSSVTVNGKDLSLNDGVANYTVSANGTYTFVATDVAGNTTTQSVVVSKIDKVTPTAPVITGGSTTYSDTNDAKGVKVYVKTAGTTGPSGIKEYEIQAHNYLTDITPKFRKTVSGFTISDKTYTTTNSDPYIRFDDFGPNGVYFNNVIIAFTQPTTKDISLRVYAWAKGSSPSAGQKISVTVPKGTNGWYYVPNFTAGTYDGLQFNFGGTAGDTYTINSFRYVNSTSSSKASDNYAYTESRRGQTGIYYRTVANNGLKSSWTTLDANSWAYISKVVAESNGFRYTTLQKAIDFATNNTATSIKMLKNVDESVSVASTKNIILNGNGFYNRSTNGNGLKNEGKLTINKMTFVSTTNSGVYSSGGTLIVNNTSDTNKDYYFSTETNGNNGLYISGGTVTVNDGYFASASKSCIVVNGGTLNFIHGNIQLPSIGKNAILFNNGIVNIGDNTSADPQKTNKLIIRGNEDENNCVSAIKMSDGNTGTLNVKRGYITGCIGINQEAKATGKINITGTATSIIAIHTGINLNSTTNNLLTVGTSGSTNTENPRIVANGDEYFAIQAPTSTVGFKMYSGRLVTNIASVYQGKNTATVSGKTFTTTKAANGKYYTIWK